MGEIIQPGYIALHRAGELHARVQAAMQRLAACNLCPRACGVNRLQGETGFCRAGLLARVASANVHPWEEPPISGTRGSGTVFLSHCTARCLFCQNYPISQQGVGREMTAEQLADAMLRLQKQGCHNINFVTPTHYVPQLLAAVEIAAERGLRIPLLYNTSGYDSVETLRLLEGVIDIYLPDSKYADDEVARQLSGYQDYVQHNRAALLEMRRQVGAELVLDDKGLARRGMIVRHLVLPHGLSQTPQVLRWIAEHLSPQIHISLMAQYFPAHRAVGHPTLGRRLLAEEYEAALAALDYAGLENGWQQELECDDHDA
ncbi:MAG: radical SAM protein [Chloroflexi bacterium]|nr:radical SAM protein [Chloroflexota bacterium]